VGLFYGVRSRRVLETQVSRGRRAQVPLLYGGQNGVSASAGCGGDEVRKARVGRFIVQKHGDCAARVARRERAGLAGAGAVKGVEGLTNAVAVRSWGASNCFPPRDPGATAEWLCTRAEQMRISGR
jgi:hypothetical protein